MLICWDFTMQAGFTENILEKIKSPVNSSFLSKNALLVSKVRGEWPHCYQVIEKKE